jgi:hypothetical protein
VSFYSDDVVLFLRTTNEEISITMDILQVFGEVSGLCNNVQKSSVFPIQCSDDEKTLVQQLLPCEMSDFLSRPDIQQARGHNKAHPLGLAPK